MTAEEITRMVVEPGVTCLRDLAGYTSGPEFRAEYRLADGRYIQCLHARYAGAIGSTPLAVEWHISENRARKWHV